MNARRQALAFAGDVVAVVLFAALGRRSHSESMAGALGTSAPFLLGLVVAWAATRAHRAPLALLTGLALGPLTAGVGLALRASVFDRGVATSFMVVAFITLTVFIAGWRAVVALLGRARPVADGSR